MYDQAVEIVLKTRRPSISLVQRHLRIGYNRAARLIEAMEHAGLVSPMNSSPATGKCWPPTAPNKLHAASPAPAAYMLRASRPAWRLPLGGRQRCDSKAGMMREYRSSISVAEIDLSAMLTLRTPRIAPRSTRRLTQVIGIAALTLAPLGALASGIRSVQKLLRPNPLRPGRLHPVHDQQPGPQAGAILRHLRDPATGKVSLVPMIGPTPTC